MISRRAAENAAGPFTVVQSPDQIDTATNFERSDRLMIFVFQKERKPEFRGQPRPFAQRTDALLPPTH